MPKVAVVIPNWNGLRHLPECLESLVDQSFRDFETVLVDNASSDTSVDWVHTHHPEVRVLRREDNGGFSKAVNAGISQAQGEYVALLNNDTVAEPRWLEALVTALDERPDYDLAASRMTLFDDSERMNAAGDTYSLWRLSGRNRGFGAPRSRYQTTERVLGACAGAALYRRALFDDVGLFDEDFFLMSEDTDFNLRCLIAGKRCLYVPDAQVRHKVRSSIDTRPVWEMIRLATRNEAMVVAKDMPTAVLALVPLLLPYRLLRQTFPVRPSKWHLIPLLLKQTPGRLRAQVEGFRLGLAKRADVWSRRTIGTSEIMRWLVKGSGPA